MRSVLGGELYALTDAYDSTFLLRYDLAHIFTTWSPLVLLTDSMSLLNLLIHKTTISKDKRLMIDITDFRQAYDRRDITDIGWLRSGKNIAEAFTKPGSCLTLDAYLATAILELDVAQWMVRSPRSAATSTGHRPLLTTL